MMPRALVPEAVREKRRAAVRKAATTTHRPHLFCPTSDYDTAQGLGGPWTEPPPDCFRELEPEALALVA